MNDFDTDLLALLNPGSPSPMPAEPESREPATEVPELDLAALLAPAQAAPESVAVPDYIAQLTEIAARRLNLETELYDLFLQLESTQELLQRGLWLPEHAATLRVLRKRIDSQGLDWRWTETQAWKAAYNAGVIPQFRNATWTPFDLLAFGDRQ